MGLVHPVTCKVSQNFGRDTLAIGCASMQGYRQNMEDTLTVVLGLENHPSCSFFAVFDGHGGTAAAEYAKTEIVRRINDLKVIDEEGIRDAILQADQKFLQSSNKWRKHGSCAIMAVVQEFGNHCDIICANIGDSRGILGTIPENIQADVSFQVLTRDHKPDLVTERDRIVKAGGFVDAGRVDGTLAVSRALGDWVYKSNELLDAPAQKVISVPEFTHFVARKDNFLLLACDGIFEAMTNRDVAAHITQELVETSSANLSTTAGNLLNLSLEAGSRDNMTTVLIIFNRTTQVNENKKFIQPSILSLKRAVLTETQKREFTRAYYNFGESEGFGKEAKQRLQNAGFAFASSPGPREGRQQRRRNRNSGGGNGRLDWLKILLISAVLVFVAFLLKII